MTSGTGTQVAVGAVIVESTNDKNFFPAAMPKFPLSATV